MKIHYRGFWNYSGYAFAAMTNVAALKKAGHQVNVSYYSSATYFPPTPQFQGSPDVVIDHCQPGNWPNTRVQGALNIGYTTWEADKIPANWLPHIHKMDQLWVPCQWNKEVFIESGVKIPIHVIPHHVKAPVSQRAKRTDGKFRFYTIATAHSRKNYMGLLKAFKEVLKVFPNVELWVKISGERSNSYKKEFVHAGVWEHVKWIDKMLSIKEMDELHASCDCFVSLNTGEGFGIPIANAMAHGNEVIVTGYGAVRDYALNYAKLVPFVLGPVDVTMEEHGFDQSMNDAKADWKEASLLMMEAVNHGRRDRSELANNLVKTHSLESIGAMMIDAMNDREMTIRFKDNGIGDMICFLYAFEGFRRQHEALNVKLKWNDNKAQWMLALSKLVNKIKPGPEGYVTEISNSVDPVDFRARSVSSRGYRRQYADLLYCEPVNPFVRRGDGMVMIFPGAAWADRIWKKENFAVVANSLAEKGYTIRFCDDVSDNTPAGHVCFNLTPSEVIRQMKDCSLVIANESGMAHLAGLLGVPCICISGHHPKSRAHDLNNVEVLLGNDLDDVSPQQVIDRSLEILE